jgi:hypothetical protein
MKTRQTIIRKALVAFVLVTFLAGPAKAEISGLFDISDDITAGRYYASNDVSKKAAAESEEEQSEENERFLNYGALHKYLGYGTLLMAGVAAATGADKSSHCIPGYATAGMAALTCLTGFMEYGGEYFDFSEGFNAYNTHILLGSLATAGFIATVAIADSSSAHAGLGGASAVTMVIPVVIILW